MLMIIMCQVSHRVVFPLELRLYNTSDDCQNPDRLYDLVAAVIHCGTGPNRYEGLSQMITNKIFMLSFILSLLKCEIIMYI